MTADPLATPERIALAGDWHANAEHAVRAIQYAAERGANVVVHLGDFGYTFEPRFLKNLDRALRETGLPLLFVDGNHEHHVKLGRYPISASGLRQLGPQLWHLPRGFRWTWDGVRFLACGGAYSVDRQLRVPRVSWWPEEEITDEDVTRCIYGGPADVLLAHDCPTGVVIPGIDDRPMSEAPFPYIELVRAGEHRQQLRRIVDATRPRWIWHGHYHRLYQREADFGYGPVTVTGLDMDGMPLARNMQIVDMANLATALIR